MANKSFSIVFDASMNISQMTSAVKKIQAEFNKLQLGGSFQKSFTSLLVELDSAIKNFETKSGQEITSKKDVTEIENATRKIVNLYERLKIEAKTLSGISNKELQKFFPEDLEKGLKQVKSYLDEYEKTVEKNNKEIEDKQKQQRQAQEKLNKAQQKDAAKGRQRISASEMRDLKNSQAQLNKQRKKQQETIAQLEEEREKRITSGDMRIKKDGTADKRYGDAASNQKLLDDTQKARVELETLNQQYNQVSDKISGSITEADYNRNLENIQREIKEAQKAVTDFEQEISGLKANPQSTESFENLRKEVEKLTGLDLSDITQDLDGFERLKQIFDDFQTGKIEELKTKINQLDGAVEVFGQGAVDAKRKGQALDDTFTEMSREAQDLARLQDQVLDFFSLSNTIQIFKNAIRDAFETVKELDAVMTETAVVTDFSIGDMWDKLPEYSKEANKLGTSIKSLYEATTLYYQQGLNSDQAMDVGIETMKMARIANMDAAAATEAMTAALRGFNMEINETNATRINDVYSELAAITAADTEQIATAMSKTASIADAANMEFETTAAFLAQIIETTQEAPETAGTAMKTIIARFTEVKELFDEGMLSGKDAEGEEININKIDAALKKVGISLNDFLKGEKGIDDIFLELASKWDTLDLATQRYIATTAAGSRQQSRFLAMMSNYDRTMELVTAANNSAGASQKQFDKTLESLEAKLQRLNNAWQEFTMGLANNEVIKAGVDLLTWLLETINKITGVAGNEGLGGVITMFARLATVIGALKGGGAIIKGLLSEVVKTGGLTKEQMKMMGTLGMDEAGNWVKDISLMNILMNTLNITTEKSHILFGKLGIAVTKAATGFKLAGAEGAVAGAAVTIGWLPVIGIIAAIIAVVWALVAAFKAAHAASPEGKLEAASAAADGAAEAAEGAAQAYEHLAAALGSIGGKSAVLENLAVGTTEWKNAVQELNGEVLDLVEQYPELAQFIDSGDGYLKLDMEGSRVIDGEEKTVKDILSDYQENKFKAQSASAAAKLQKQQAQIDLDYSKLDNNIKITPKIDIPEYNPLYYSTQISQLQGGPYSAERAQKIEAIQKEWAEAEKAYNEAKVKEANALFSPETRGLTDKVAKAIASNQIEGISIDEKAKNKTIIVDGESYTFDDNRYDKLREYGEGLVAADAATKVFTDSLLSNALMTVEVSEEQKSNMMNFLDSEQVNGQVEDMLNTITTNWTKLDERQQYKQDYADIMDYEYDKSKDRFLKDGQEVEVSDESIRRQMAGVKVQENLNAKMQNLDKTLNLIDDNAEGLPSTFERMTEKGEGAALTFNDLQKIQSKTDEELISELYKDENLGLSNIYETEDEFVQFMRNSAKLGQEQMDQATKNLETINMSDYITKDMNLDIGQTKNVSDLLYEAVVQSGLDKGKELAVNLKRGLEEESEGKKLAEALGMIDSSNIDSIKKLSEYLTDLDYIGTINIDQLEQEIIEATNASKKFTLDNLKEEIGSIQELAKDIKERDETDVTYTKEERDELVKSGVGKEFFVSTGKDEFTYIGESNEQLVAALQANTAALLGKTEEQLREAAQKSESWGKLQETDLEKYDLLQGIAEGTIKPNWDNITAVKAAMEGAGIAVGDLIKDGNYVNGVLDIMKDRIISEYTDFGSAAAQMTNQNNLQSYYEDGTAQLAYSSMTGQQILNTSTQIDPATGQPIVNQQSREVGSQVLEAKLAQQEGGRVEAESLIKNNEALKEYGDLVKAAVTDSAEYEKKLTKLADTIEDNTDALSGTKKGTRDYEKALDKVTDAAKDAFGDDITKEFVEENLDLFKEFAKGSEGSVEKIRDKIIESFTKSGKYTETQLEGIQQATESLDGLNFDIYGHADASQIFSELAAVMGSAEAAAAVLESLGYSVTWELTGTTVDEATGMALNSYRAVVTNTAGNVVGGRGGGGGGGGGGGEEWENPYDKLYNLTEKINNSIREREQIERRYQRLIDRRIATAAELQRNSQAEIESLKEQAKLQQQMIEGRREMMEEEMEENSDLQKYATINTETGLITIDWELIDSVTDEEEGSKIEEYISKLEELRDSMHEAQDALEDINDAVWEIEERGREEYLEWEERIKAAYVEVRQKEIDTLEEINESINDTNDKLLDSIQQSIDKMRQDRENEKTEEDLQEKQRRLAYLEQDTSNANAMEILELREEIEEGQEDYTDTLIDQKISELQEQNDKAAEQREKQITLLQNQLDWEIESGRIWQVVEALMQDGLNPQGGLIRGSMLEQILRDGEQWTGLSDIGQMNWLLDLETMIAESMNWRMTKGQLENLHEKKTDQEIEFINSKGEKLTGTVDEKGQVWTGKDTYYKDVYQWIDGTYHTTENAATKYVAPKSSSGSGSSKDSGSSKGGKQYPYQATYIDANGKEVTLPGTYSSIDDAAAAVAKANEGSGSTAQGTITNYTNPNDSAKITADDDGSKVAVNIDGKTTLKKYKTGGLADFTGPAWLDGTKSRPELVLNQRDTQNFIQLKDILSSIMSRNFSNTSTATENNGDITYDIDINVETVGSDYDVEQVANKVKSMINEDARYRNNNAISLKR